MMKQQFKPLKAADVVDTETLKYPIIAMTKYDGVHGLVKDGVLLGRSLKPIANKWISEILSTSKYNGFVGELCYGTELNIQSLCRDTTSHTNSINKVWYEGFTWMLFDYVHEDVINLPYQERLQALEKVVSALPMQSYGNIQIAPYTLAQSATEVDEHYEANLEAGYEGLVLRCPNGEWKNGRSTLKQQLFLRMKPQSDSEFVITDVVEALQNNNEAKTNELGYTERSSHQENKVGKGMLGSFLGIDIVSGMEITVGAGKLTHQERIHYFENPPIGAIGKYRSMDTGVKNLPRFPRFYSFRNIEDLDDGMVDKAIRISQNAINEYNKRGEL